MPRILPPPPVSTRRATRETGQFTRSTPGSQALERGLQLLRVFRPGIAVLTNSQLSHRTGLARPTVSRLTRSLVDAGFLAYDTQEGGYRLTAVCLSMALSFRGEQHALDLALPLMRGVAEGQRINVGMAVADQLEMVYLDSVRHSRLGVFRRMVPGSRIPMELTSLGRAYLAGVDEAERVALLNRLALQHGRNWPALEVEVRRALVDVERVGYCHVMWQPGMLAVAAPIVPPCGRAYVLNISFPCADAESDLHRKVKRHAAILLELAARVRETWNRELALL